jgi:hypothetical protein
VNYRETQSFTTAKSCRIHFRCSLVASPACTATRPHPLKTDWIGLPALYRRSNTRVVLALGQRQRPQVLPVQLQQVEGLEDCIGDAAAPVERIEHGDAVGTGDHRLAVQRERLGAHLGRGRSDGGIAVCPVIAAAGEQAHGLAVAANDQPITSCFDSCSSRPVGGFSKGVCRCVGFPAGRNLCLPALLTKDQSSPQSTLRPQRRPP